MRKVEGTISSGITGLPILHAQVSILKADTTPAQLYSDQGVTPLSQPVLTNGLGYYSFFIPDGTYTRVVANPDGSNPITFPNEEMYEDARNVSVPVGEPGIVLPSIGARSGKVLGFDGLGAPVATDQAPGPKGDPGGSSNAFGLLTAGASFTIPGGIDIIRTTGFRTIGKGAAAYKRSTAGATTSLGWGSGIWWFQSADGAYWEIAEPRPDLLMFGGYDNGLKTYDSYTATGTDNAPAMNALLYYCQVKGYNTAYVPEGNYLFADTVHVGYGGGTLGNYSHVDLVGAGPTYNAYGPQASFAGTQFIFTQTDRPGINVQGARNTTIKGITIVGMFSKYAIDNFLAFNNGSLATQPRVDDREVGWWWDPGMSPMQDGRFTPYAAITVDAFSGGGGMGGVGGSSRPTAPNRVASTAYTYGDVVVANSNVYVCRFPGTTSGGSGPSGTGTAITDGTATWAYMGVYDGANPSKFISYGDVTYPAYTGIATQYGKGQSSKVNIVNCNIDGWIAAVAVQPCNYDGNGDFTSMKDCLVQYCKYFISAGNSQGRNVHIEDCTGQQIHTFIEGLTHGKRGGRFQGSLINISMGNIMQLINGGASSASPLNWTDCYIEVLDRIGNMPGIGGCMNFFGGELYMTSLTYQNSRGIPDNHFSGSSTRQYMNGAISPVSLFFYGTQLRYSGILGLFAQTVQMFGGETEDIDVEGTAPNWYNYAFNGLAGGLVTPEFGMRPGANSQVFLSHKFRARSGATGSRGSAGSLTNGVWPAAVRLNGSPVYCRKIMNAGLSGPVDVERVYTSLPKSQFPDLTLTGIVLSGTYASGILTADFVNILPGDVLVDVTTGKTFFVYSFDTGTKVMLACLRNGFSGLASSEVQTGTPFSTTVGNFNTCSGRVYTPSSPMYVTANASITIVGDTASTVLLANVVGASKALIGLKATGTGIPANTYVLGVDGNTVLISNAATATATGITFTFGTATGTLIDVGDISSTAGGMTGIIGVGDYFGVEGIADAFMDSNAGASITAFSDATRTITCTRVAQWPPRVKMRLKTLRAAPPANVGTPYF